MRTKRSSGDENQEAEYGGEGECGKVGMLSKSKSWALSKRKKKLGKEQVEEVNSEKGGQTGSKVGETREARSVRGKRRSTHRWSLGPGNYEEAWETGGGEECVKGEEKRSKSVVGRGSRQRWSGMGMPPTIRSARGVSHAFAWEVREDEKGMDGNVKTVGASDLHELGNRAHGKGILKKGSSMGSFWRDGRKESGPDRGCSGGSGEGDGGGTAVRTDAVSKANFELAMGLPEEETMEEMLRITPNCSGCDAETVSIRAMFSSLIAIENEMDF